MVCPVDLSCGPSLEPEWFALTPLPLPTRRFRTSTLVCTQAGTHGTALAKGLTYTRDFNIIALADWAGDALVRQDSIDSHRYRLRLASFPGLFRLGTTEHVPRRNQSRSDIHARVYAFTCRARLSRCTVRVCGMEVSGAKVDRLVRLYPKVDESETPLPRAWSVRDKYTYIGLSQGNLRVHYKGTCTGKPLA